tara:strand:- start:591 stop:1571 length:981 start_codon:yes stop_codon:yes gene_type:complete
LDRLDQYYTNGDVAAACLKKLDFSDYDIVLEPSAGDGAFFNLLPPGKRVGVDLEPKAPEIKEGDFFNYCPLDNKKYLVVGNPPFGKNSSLAKRFFNHASTFADTIGFILPRTFRKAKTQNQLQQNFHLISEEILPAGSFYLSNGDTHDVPCVFQIWERRNKLRKKILLPEEHKDFLIIGADDYEIGDKAEIILGGDDKRSFETSLEEWKVVNKYRKDFPFLFSDFSIRKIERKVNWKVVPDIVFRRAGAQAGKITTDYEKASLEGNMFIRVNNEKVVDIFQKMWDTWWDPKVDINKKSVKWDTAGTPSISKTELVEHYIKMKGLIT